MKINEFKFKNKLLEFTKYSTNKFYYNINKSKLILSIISIILIISGQTNSLNIKDKIQIKKSSELEQNLNSAEKTEMENVWPRSLVRTEQEGDPFLKINNDNFKVAGDVARFFEHRNHMDIKNNSLNFDYKNDDDSQSLGGLQSEIQESGYKSYESLIDILKNKPEAVMNQVKIHTDFDNNNSNYFSGVKDLNGGMGITNKNFKVNYPSFKSLSNIDLDNNEDNEDDENLTQNENKFIDGLEENNADREKITLDKSADYFSKVFDELNKTDKFNKKEIEKGFFNKNRRSNIMKLAFGGYNDEDDKNEKKVEIDEKNENLGKNIKENKVGELKEIDIDADINQILNSF